MSATSYLLSSQPALALPKLSKGLMIIGPLLYTASVIYTGLHTSERGKYETRQYGNIGRQKVEFGLPCYAYLRGPTPANYRQDISIFELFLWESVSVMDPLDPQFGLFGEFRV